jgi:hypothetical protein
MTAAEITTHDVLTFDELKSLARAKGPCLTIIEPIAQFSELHTRLKNVLQAARKELASRGAESAEFLGPLQDLATTLEAQRGSANALIVVRSPEVFRYLWLRGEWKESVTVADRFQVRELFAAMAREQRFHVLAFSQKHMRLYHCTQHAIEEAKLEKVAPVNLRNWLHTRQPDHDLENRATGGPGTGSMKGVVFGTSSDREREDEYLRHFFAEVDRGVAGLLRDDPAPLVLAGVEGEVALYRRLNTHPRLLERAISGAPDGFSSEQELHERGWEIAGQSPPEVLQKALSDFTRQSEHGNTSRVSRDVREVVKAAFEGRVADLFFTANARLTGVWDEMTNQVRVGPGEDLVNAAALETVGQSGRAFELPADRMPVKEDVAAVLRF